MDFGDVPPEVILEICALADPPSRLLLASSSRMLRSIIPQEISFHEFIRMIAVGGRLALFEWLEALGNRAILHNSVLAHAASGPNHTDNFSLVQYLLPKKSYPLDAISTAAMSAARAGNKALFLHFIRNNRLNFLEDIACSVCEQGWLDVVNALTHPPWSWSLTPAFLRGAVRGKHVALVEYLMENRCIYDPWEAIDNAIAPRDFPFFIQMSKLLGFNSFGARITVRAIEEGVVDILKWRIQGGETLSSIPVYALNTIGSLDMAHLLTENYPSFLQNRRLLGTARVGSLELILFLEAQGVTFEDGLSTCLFSAPALQNLPLLQHFLAQGRTLTANDLESAISRHLPAAEWFLEWGAPVSAGALLEGVKLGHLPFLRRLLSVASPTLEKNQVDFGALMTEAAGRGHLDMVKLFARERGVPMTSTMLYEAILHQRANTCRWLVLNGCPSDKWCSLAIKKIAGELPELAEWYRGKVRFS